MPCGSIHYLNPHIIGVSSATWDRDMAQISCSAGTKKNQPGRCRIFIRLHGADFRAVVRTRLLYPDPNRLKTSAKRWFAVKIYTDRASIIKYLADRSIEIFIPMVEGKRILGSIVFLHSTENDIIRAKEDWYSQLVVYRDPEGKRPQAIPDEEMDNFRRVLSLKGQEFIPLEVYDRSFLKGETVRVTDGPLKGATGVIKRIKGDRRLVVSITGIAAIATCFVHPDMLEKVADGPAEA